MGEKYVLFSIFNYTADSFIYDRLEIFDKPAKPGLWKSIASRQRRISKVVKTAAVKGAQKTSRMLSRVFSSSQIETEPGSSEAHDDTIDIDTDSEDSGDLEGSDMEVEPREDAGDPLQETFELGVLNLDDIDISVGVESEELDLPLLEPLNRLIIPGTEDSKDFESLHVEHEQKELERELNECYTPESGVSAGGSYAVYSQPSNTKEGPSVLEGSSLPQTSSSTVQVGSPGEGMSRSSTGESLRLGASSSIDDFKRPEEPYPENPHNGGMSLVYCNKYLYVIGVVVDRFSTRGVLRTKVREGNFAWEKVEDMPIKCPFHSSVAFDKRIFVSGGRTKNKMSMPKLDTFFILNTRNPKGGWAYAPHKLREAREKHTLLCVSGNFFVIGGVGDEELRTVEHCIEFPLGVEKGWKQLAPMNDPRSCFAAAARRRHIYVVGGVKSDCATTVSVERYDIIEDNWIRFKPLSVTQRCPQIGFTMDNWICILGREGRCYDTSKTRTTNDPPPSGESSTRPDSLQLSETERVWQPLLRDCKLPPLNLKGRSAIIVPLQYKDKTE